MSDRFSPRMARLRCEPLEARDTPAAGVLEVTSAMGALESGIGSTITVYVLRSDGTDGTVSATLTGVAGSTGAQPGSDYAAGPFTVTFAPGETIKTIDVPVLNDNVAEPTETATFALSNPTGGATLGTRVTVTAQITDDDATLVVTSIQPSAFNEPAQTTVRVTGADPLASLPGDLGRSFAPFPGFSGPVTVALGEVNRDGVRDIIAGASVNGHVKIFDGKTGAELRSFLAYSGYTGAVRLAAGDLTGDGVADIVTGSTINAHVKVFDGATGAEVRSFLAYPGWTGAVDVTVGDVTGDRTPDIITGADVNGHVKVFDGKTGAEVRSFLAYSGYTGAARVAAGDTDGDGIADIITGAPGNGHFKVFNGRTGTETLSFLGTRGAIVDVAADADGDGLTDIIAGESALPSAYSSSTGSRFQSGSFDRLNTNFVYVG